MKLSSVPLILAVAALAVAPAAFAGEKSGGRIAAIYAWVVEYLDGRAVIDPNGLAASPCVDPYGGGCQNESLRDEGGYLDPNGLQSAGRPEGSGLDPHGGNRGFSIDPNGLDQGSAADPNG